MPADYKDICCRGCWNLGNNCRKCGHCRATASHVCPVCGRLGQEWSWLTHPAFGCRYCPDCEAEGLGKVVPCENPDRKDEEA